jgi:hypothetical protein
VPFSFSAVNYLDASGAYEGYTGFHTNTAKWKATMTQLLERAVEKVRALPEREQDAVAALILNELEDEARWDKAFAGSHDALARLAAETAEEHEAGRTKELDPDKL